ncbi:hypothetical protein KKB84_04550, partial [bacterium]|nr:hypothetical protein [bacterium]
SLKIEQKLDENTFAESKPRIFTTGAFLVPLEIIKNGIKRYVWVVDEFADNASSMMELFVYLIYIHIAKTVYCNHRRGLMIILSIKEM